MIISTRVQECPLRLSQRLSFNASRLERLLVYSESLGPTEAEYPVIIVRAAKDPEPTEIPTVSPGREEGFHPAKRRFSAAVTIYASGRGNLEFKIYRLLP